MQEPRRISATTCHKSPLVILMALSLGALAGTAGAHSATSFDYENQEPDPDQVPVNSLELVATASSAGSVQCEPISLKLCAHLAYKSTRMPNFFRDSSQVEASERSFQYENLVSSKCSQHLHAYICELLTPVCLQDGHEVMRRFEIYPCRSFCRRIKRDCETEISRHEAHLFREYGGGASLLPAFACDQLPFESNGGNGTLQGPCHDAPETQPPSSNPQSSAKSSYRPYKPQLDENVPPYITDTSRLDAKIVLPAVKFPPDLDPLHSSNSSPSEPTQQVTDKSRHQASLASQLQSWGQSLVWTVARYSNYISVVSVLLLLVALNSKRLSRLRRQLRLSPGGSSAKSSSASSQQGKLIGGVRQVSPSSSSRSLMLIAGNNKQPASHQLVTGAGSLGELSEPSQKLLHGLSQQRTLINVNGTLERQQQLNRYLIMQSDKQQLFNTLDSHSSQSNQYDYIQVPPEQAANNRARQQQQQQLYSNILLSSPGHQVLLYNGSTQTGTSYVGRPPRGAPPSPGGRHAPYYTSSLASPYASSSPGARFGQVSEAGGGSERSFQGAARKGSTRVGGAQGYASAASSSGSSAGESPASSAGSAAKALLLSQQRQQR